MALAAGPSLTAPLMHLTYSFHPPLLTTVSVPESAGRGEHGVPFSPIGSGVCMSPLWLLSICMQRQARPQEDPSMD